MEEGWALTLISSSRNTPKAPSQGSNNVVWGQPDSYSVCVTPCRRQEGRGCWCTLPAPTDNGSPILAIFCIRDATPPDPPQIYTLYELTAFVLPSNLNMRRNCRWMLWHASFICCATDMHSYQGARVTEQGACFALQRKEERDIHQN